ncbi:hypothetical protein FACS189413_15080 [Bacteroidia bacterium]|nr:hypothetical protein FACS189413_15080 [Bacteroidia bacterium]
MKKINLFFLITIYVITFTNCTNDELVSEFNIQGLTVENFPKIDGSTSNEPLMRIITCKLLNFKYEWKTPAFDIYTVISEEHPEIYQLAKTSQTHNSILNLIDGTAEIVFSARKMSPYEQEYADNKSVSLIETPIASDAFVFIVNPQNTINSLEHNQIVNIYTKKITHWNEVGGNNAEILPYHRNQNSGSQELMESLVMQETPMADFPSQMEIPGMFPVFSTVRWEENAICYAVYYYKERMVVEEFRNSVKTLAINGITPNGATIKNGTYPFVAPVYVMIRSDLDKNSNAYKLYELMQTKAGKTVIEESGYIVH